MLKLADRPIKTKLVVIIMVTTTAALGIAGFGIIFADTLLFRQSLERDLSALARIVADNTTAALAFDDADAAGQTLRALRARPHVEQACIYREDGTVLASYVSNAQRRCPTALPRRTERFTDSSLVAAEPVVLRGEQIGSVMLIYDLEEIGQRERLYGLAVLGVLLISSVLAFVLASRLRAVVTGPVMSLVSAATAVSESGDYTIRAKKLTGDELGVLVDGFNAMLAGIEARENELKKVVSDREAALREAERERERFRFMAESMPQKIFTAHPDGTTDYINAQWTQFTGTSLDFMKAGGWVEFVHPDDLSASLRLWQKCLASGAQFQIEHRMRRADGKYRWHLSTAHAMRDSKGRITMWIGSSTEIHEQKDKEEALRRANEDLQQFAYSASHDLQEPIRNVAVYSEIVANRYQHVLDEDGQQFLGFLRDGGRRLATLVRDLLAYTRASMMELSETPISSAEVFEKSLANLTEAIRECKAVVTHDTLPDVFMGESHLQQIFQNLIGNALKYRGDQPPRVHVSSSERDGFWCFMVRDNGIGIDPQYKERIFGLFKRLHHDTKYGGTGIGLAICQRVVERYGGRIWVESQPGKGSSFFFTLPRHAKADASESTVG